MAMAEVVQLETGKPKDETKQQREIVALLENELEAAKSGQTQSIIMYIERIDGFHIAAAIWEGSLKTLGMAEMLKADIVRRIYEINNET
jgi:hypothetical protein